MNKGNLINFVKIISKFENIGILIITLVLAIKLTIGMYQLNNYNGLSMDSIKFSITIFSIFAVFSRSYENEKAQITCFLFIILDISIYLFFIFCNKEVTITNKLAYNEMKYLIMMLDGVIIWSVCYFLYRYSTMPLIYKSKKYEEYSNLIYMLYNKSLNYSLNDSEKLKIKKFCEEEISKLSTIRLRVCKYIFKKRYLKIMDRINMYKEINGKLSITFNI